MFGKWQLTFKTELATEYTEITEEKQTVITKLRITFWATQQNRAIPILSLCSLHPQGVGRGCKGLKPQQHTL
jgi:hypothetical protein